MYMHVHMCIIVLGKNVGARRFKPVVPVPLFLCINLYCHKPFAVLHMTICNPCSIVIPNEAPV